MSLETAFGVIRDALNDELVGGLDGLAGMVSMSPKHPDFVEADEEYPYLCMEYAGETPEWEGADIRWITPSRETGLVRLWLAVRREETSSASMDLLKFVKKVRDVITAVTADASRLPADDFRVRVDGVETTYEPSGRWGLATITLVIGAYGD